MKKDNQTLLTIEQLNTMSPESFVCALGHIFEHSQWVVEKAWQCLPFDDLDDLHNAMKSTVIKADKTLQLHLICAHPELAGKSLEEGTLTVESNLEQRGAGLNSCSPNQLTKLRELNRKYRKNFEFPFILAVNGLDVDTIIEIFSQRLGNNKDEEFQRALEEVFKITRLRLEGCLQVN